MVERQELDARVDGFGRNLGIAEAAWRVLNFKRSAHALGEYHKVCMHIGVEVEMETAPPTGNDVCEAPQRALNLRHLAGILGDEVVVHAQPFRRH